MHLISPRGRFCISLPATAFLVACFSALARQGVVAGDETDKPEPKRVISGKITDRKGVPVSAARVTLYRWESPTKRWGKWKTVQAAVTTDPAGSFRFADLARDYFMLSIESDGFARAFRDVSMEEGPPQDINIVLQPPAATAIRVVNEAGAPVVEARVRGFVQRGVNGQCRFGQLALNSLDIKIATSDADGGLKLPALPAGDVLQLISIDHLNFAPASIDQLMVGATATVTMQSGVAVTFRVPANRPDARITDAVVDLRPSTFLDYEAEFDQDGIARLTLKPGNYDWLLLQHKDFFLTPVYSGDYRKQFLKIEPGRNQALHFDLRRKVTARGRVLDAATGKPLREMGVMGELDNGPLQGWDDAPPSQWSFAGWGESDERGEYQIQLAAGRARVSFQGSDYLPEQDYFTLVVAPDGSTVIPDIRLRTLPKIVGSVQDPNGKPVAKAVVRLRGEYRGMAPVLTDELGRFELPVQYIRMDETREKRLFDGKLVAFDPYRPLAATAEVRLDKPQPVVLKLEAHEPDWLLSDFVDEMTDWERGTPDADEATKLAAISLRGKSPPALDGVAWLNTGEKKLQWSDLRGKYVLLDFWFIGCGPCHEDFASVKLVHELYKEKGVVVIGVHNNSQTADVVRAQVSKIGLAMPVVVDHPDGRLVAGFQQHGLPNGYPHHVLISPQGNVLLDDRAIPHPTLRNYKLEIIRRLLLDAQAAK